ncbi:DNA mismatch repair protein MutS [Oscillochloris trichoides DG-6]|uniref:DNA mismatch repair protein MutS n=1 Tax=Oscillochloris trichoides DG-6 TaxID=765420 RepID=E1IDX6_9CHLR|nr:DNA mismatch repair protein MutS [Oscillochloris trichoides]EFO80587.1 DNA mismatch repair protein MutS [Oscillochloris trichoides DG-6]
MAKVEIHQWYRQYRKLKAEAEDAILLFRFGDFYETFDDDAKLIAELLDVTLTRKDFAVDKGRPKEEQKLFTPMAGMPYHAVERYVNDLVARGYRVAIAEQLSETEASRSDTRPKSIFAAGLQQIVPGEMERKMVHREIVRVITPGTVVDPSMLTATSNTYLAAAITEGGQIGLAYAELSTGEFAAIEFSGERAAAQLQGELARLQVAEVLVPDDPHLRVADLAPAEARLTQDLAPLTKDERDLLLPHERVARRLDQDSEARWTKGHVTAWPSWRWDIQTAQETLTRQLRVQSLAAFGLDGRPLATRAAGALLQYVHQTQRHQANQINRLRVYTTSSFMFLDPQTRRNLELLESSSATSKTALIHILDRTRTPMGARLLRRWLNQPLLELEPLLARQEAIAACVEATLLRAELRQALGQVGDMERAVNRVAQGVTVATPRDMVQLRTALRALPEIITATGTELTAMIPEPSRAMPPAGSQPAQPAEEEEEDLFAADAPSAEAETEAPHLLDACNDIAALLERALDDDPPALLGSSNYLRGGEEGGERPRRVLRPGFEPRIDALVRASRHAQEFIDRLEGRERDRTGIRSLKVGYNSVFGYYIEVSRTTDEKLIPKDYQRKQTLVGAERYVTEELKEYEQVIDRAKLQLVEMEREAFARLCEEIGQHTERLREVARILAQLDVVAALAEVAVRGRYTRPSLNTSTRLQIRGGRHPVVEQMIPETFVPNDILIDTTSAQMLIITGPNMSGKSTVMRQVALIVLLAQIGAFVPAESAEVGLVDRIFTRIGAQDDIATGQSTFMVEMTETAALLVQSSRRSLIILDEVGRGTSTYDGMAIARAVVEYIHNEPQLQCRTLFATHYHELTALEHELDRVRNLHMAAIEQGKHVVFLHQLREGGADRSYGIHVAELAGIPRPVIQRASELLAELEAGRSAAPIPVPPPTPTLTPPPREGQLSLFDLAPNPVIEYLRRLKINDLTPLEALNRLAELQRLAEKAVS